MTAQTILPANTLSSGYDVANSVRFNDDDGPILSKSTGTPSSRRIFTFSCWTKRSGFNPGGSDPNKQLFSIWTDTSNRMDLRFQSGNTIDFYHTSSLGRLTTNRLFRDPSAWYHVCLRVDTTQSTAGNRYRLYVNGTQETSFSTETQPDQDSDLGTNFDTITVGDDSYGTSHFDGYLAEVCYCDGQSLAPTSFGEFDEDSPHIWKPIDVSGLTFGNNGFYLDFEDSGDLGDDESGNGNDFTESNLAATDQVTDTCTNNFAVMNNLAIHPSSTFTFKEGNLDYATSSSTRGYWVSTIAVSSGKWYWEYKATDNEARTCVGIAGAPARTNNDPESGDHDNVTVYTTINGRISYNSNAATDNYYNSATSSDDIIIGVAVDLTSSTNSIAFSIDGEWVTGSGTKSTTFANATKINSFTNVASTVNGVYHFIAGDDGGDQDIGGQANFGSPPFAISSGNADANGYGNFEYAVPSGYFALNTKNLAEYG